MAKKRKHGKRKNMERRAVRTYKDSIFRMIFSEKRELLALYNALNGSHYTDEYLLEIKTLENAIYMNIKNDLSFIIDMRLHLYEHQSTYSPNIPLRDLFYVADQLQEIVSTEELYRSTLVKIPAPEFVVFYNGTRKQPERKEFKLSDAYLAKPEDPKLELKVTMLNINVGCNQELMVQCKALRDYALYTDKVRQYAKVMQLTAAVERAVEECIHDDVLKEFLISQKAEAVKVSIYEFNQERYEKVIKEDAREEGRIEGRIEGRMEGRMEGQAAGQAMAKADALLLFLEQYGTVPDGLKEHIKSETDIERLDEMLRKALQLKSVEGFIQYIKKATKS